LDRDQEELFESKLADAMATSAVGDSAAPSAASSNLGRYAVAEDQGKFEASARADGRLRPLIEAFDRHDAQVTHLEMLGPLRAIRRTAALPLAVLTVGIPAELLHQLT
jgi:hypothetical protein